MSAQNTFLRSNGLNYKTELSKTCQADDDAFMILVMMMNLSLSGCYYDWCENNRYPDGPTVASFP